MTNKESLINKIVGDLENDLDPEQLRKVNMILLMHLDSFDLVKTSTDVVIYDERSDAAALLGSFTGFISKSLSIEILAQGWKR